MFWIGVGAGLVAFPALVAAAIFVAVRIDRNSVIRQLDKTVRSLTPGDWRYEYVLNSELEKGVIAQIELRSVTEHANSYVLLFPVNTWRIRYTSKLRDFLRLQGYSYREEEVPIRKYEKRAWGEKKLGPHITRYVVDLGEDPQHVAPLAKEIFSVVYQIGSDGRSIHCCKHRSAVRPGFVPAA